MTWLDTILALAFSYSDEQMNSKELKNVCHGFTSQEREEELNHLPFQPISENAWLKRSSSDPSLSQVGL